MNFVFRIGIIFIGGIILIGIYNPANAGHRGGGYFTFECVGQDSFFIKYTEHKLCDHALNDDTEICIEDRFGGTTSYTWDSLYSVPHPVKFCGAFVDCVKDGDYNWYTEIVFGDTVVLNPALGPYKIYHCDGGGRPKGTFFGKPDKWYLEFSLDTVICNSSAYPTLNHSDLFYCIDSLGKIQYDFVDPDGDSLVFYFTNCLTDAITPIGYILPATPSNPFPSTIGWNIDSVGNISFNAPIPNKGPVCLMVEEWRNGQRIAAVTWDNYINVIDCSTQLPPPTANSIDTTIYAGDSICMSILYDEGIIPGRVFNIIDTIWNPAMLATGASFWTNPIPTDQDTAGTFCWQPTCSMAGSGPFTLTIVTEDNSCPFTHIDSIHLNITIGAPAQPLASFTAPTPNCDSLTVPFTNSSTLDSAWSWNFGDPASGAANTSTLENPIHTFSAIGTYTVTLIAIRNCLTDTVTLVVSASTPPVVSTGPDTTLCAYENALGLGGSVSGITNTGVWTRIGGTGTFSSSNTDLNGVYNITPADSLAGNLQIVLSSTNNQWCPAVSDTFDLALSPLPDPGIVGNSPICEFDTAQNYAVSLNAGNTYLWGITGGTIIAGGDTNSCSVDWGSTGAGMLSISETTPFGCTIYDTIIVLINIKPDPVLSGALGVCGSTTHIYSTTSPGPIYNWTVSGGVIISGLSTNSITVAWGNSGMGAVTLNEMNLLGCDTTETDSVLIDPIPNPIITGPDSVCEHTTSIYSTSTPGPGYAWTVIGGTITAGAGTDSITVFWSSVGAGLITLVETNSVGCDSTDNFALTINLKPNPGIIGPIAICEYSTQTYSTTGSGPSYSWTVIGGTIISGTGTDSIVVNWDGNGIGNISLQETNTFGCDTIVAISININSKPDPILSGPITLCEYSTQVYSTSTIGPGYSWTVVGGSIISGAATSSINVKWGISGLGTVTLQETNGFTCDTTESIAITINPKPDPAISGPTTVCEFTSGNIYSTGTAGPGFVWTVTGGTITSGSGTNSITVDWQIAAAGVIALQETNSFGCDTTEIMAITINPKPDPSITGPTTVCEYTTESYNNIGTPGPGYVWTVAGGLITSGAGTNNITVFWNGDGPGTVGLQESNGLGCDTTVVVNVTIEDKPNPLIAGPAATCEFSIEQYSTHTPGPNYLWSATGGSILSGGNTSLVTVEWGATGAGSVSLYESNAAGCDTTEIALIVIGIKPNPVINGPTNVCEHTAGHVYFSPTPGPGFLWTVSGGAIKSGSGTNSITVDWNENGPGTVSLLESNGIGCDTAEIVNVTINTKPDPDITGPTTVCEYEPQIYSTVSTGPLYAWSITGGAIIAGAGTNTITVDWNGTGVGSVSLQESNGAGCDTTETLSITINLKPNPNILGPVTVCEFTTQNYNTATPGPAYNWTITNGNIISGQGTNNISVNWNGMGVGMLSLQETNSFGCDTTESVSITIDTKPNPTITGPTFVCEHTAAHAYSVGSTGSTNVWSVLGGAITSGQGTNNITVDWQGSGIGTVSIHETNVAGCDTIESISITIDLKPDPIIIGPTTICEYTNGHIYSTSTAGPGYSWSVIGGVISLGAGTNSITVIWNTSGIGTVSLQETNGAGCDTTENITITIDPKPAPVIVGPTIICEHTSGHIYSTATPGPNYLWNVIGGTIISGVGTNSIMVSWQGSGPAWITLLETNSYGCDTTDSMAILIDPKPDPDITGTFVVCENTSGYVYTTPSSGPIYNWVVGGGTIVSGAGSNTITVDWGITGVGSIGIQETNSAGCDTTELTIITINPTPSPSIIGTEQLCETAMTFDYLTASVAGNTYTWNIGGGAILSGSNTPQISATWGIFGNASLIVTETHPMGCSATDSIQILIDPVPIADITPINPTGCIPLRIEFDGSASANAYKYEWEFGNGHTTNFPLPVHIYPAPGSYNVQLIVTHLSGCKDTASTLVEAYPIPEANFQFLVPLIDNFIFFDSDSLVIENLSIGATNYFWQFGDGTTDTVVDPVKYFTEPGDYPILLKATSEHGCSNDFFKLIIVKLRQHILVPNAFSPNGDGINDYFNVTNKNFTDFHISIFNRWGQIVFESNSSEFQWDGSFNGGVAQENVYTYLIQGVNYDGIKIKFPGTITLYR